MVLVVLLMLVVLKVKVKVDQLCGIRTLETSFEFIESKSGVSGITGNGELRSDDSDQCWRPLKCIYRSFAYSHEYMGK